MITPLALLAVSVGVLAGGIFAVAGFWQAFIGTLDQDTGITEPGSLPRRTGRAPYPVWDRAWPLYTFRQLDRDIIAAVRQPVRGLANHLRRLGSSLDEVMEEALPLAPAVLIPIGFYLGVGAGILVTWIGLTVVLEIALLAPRLLTLALIGVLRGWDRALRWWRGVAATCTTCGWVAALPAFACVGDCKVVHADLRPGLLGAWSRRCECRRRVPTTITRAAASLQPVCVQCWAPLPQRCGTAADARIAVSGGPRAGKSSLVRAGARGITEYGRGPVPKASESLLCVTVHRGDTGSPTTVHLLDMESRLFEPGAENAARWPLSTTRRHLLILDGMLIPEVRHRAGLGNSGPMEVEMPYLSLVTALNSFGARSRTCSLAVVVSKADEWIGNFPRLNLRGAADASAAIRSWLIGVRIDNLVRAADRDFGAVRYFITGLDDEVVQAAGRWSHAAAPFEWLLDRHPHGTSLP
ncbi:hypothetical protein [Actinoplanes regularis]|uniref:hypothetical protein n=1 Tax=Actinoplanes regularis TaxID=52697 RepID=UPI00255234E2|nr:hypothetical protein [Actinoplanes regularis]